MKDLLAELEEDSSEWVMTQAYLWGLDLTQSFEGAGGVGGLLSITRNDAPGTTNYYPTYDANGNVMELYDELGNNTAIYRYGPFGELVSISESVGVRNPYKFSTKYFDEELELYYYGYRYYDPEMGRWLNRDPINEFAFEINKLNDGFIVNSRRSLLGIELLTGSESEREFRGLPRGIDHLKDYFFLGNKAIYSWDYLGLRYTFCSLINSVFAQYRSRFVRTPAGVKWMRVCNRRRCYFRCFYPNDFICSKEGCVDKACTGHGILEAAITFSRTGPHGGVPPSACNSLLSSVVGRGDCSGR